MEIRNYIPRKGGRVSLLGLEKKQRQGEKKTITRQDMYICIMVQKKRPSLKMMEAGQRKKAGGLIGKKDPVASAVAVAAATSVLPCPLPPTFP